MATLKSKDNKEIAIICKCGCDNGMFIKIDNSYGDYAYQSYLSSNFMKEQYGAWDVFIWKLKKIWAIIRNKDYYYSDIVLSAEDWAEFKDFVNKN